MAEPLLDRLRVSALGDQQRRVRVAKVVESHAVEVLGQRPADRRLEDALVVVRVAHRPALRSGEHGRVGARVAEVFAELLDEERRRLDSAPGAVGLRVVLDQVAANLRHSRQHDDLGVVQPQVAAAQRGDLACA
ncbi:MAG TPA: hypothetical protein VFZ70_08355 [Euzebyales bacterium]